MSLIILFRNRNWISPDGLVMIKFRCPTCEKKIAVPVEYARKLVRCPRCTQPTRVPHPKSRPKPNPNPQPASVASEPAEIEAPPTLSDLLTSEFESNDPATASQENFSENNIWSDIDFEQPSTAIAPSDAPHDDAAPRDSDKIICPRCQSKVASDTEFCTVCGARVQTLEIESAADRSSSIGRFAKDILKLFSPAKTVNENITLIILIAVSLFANWPLPGMIFFYAQYAAQGYIGAYLLNLLLETANGNNELPSSLDVKSFWDDVVRPFWLLVVCTVYAILPFFGLLFAYFHFFQPDTAEEGLTGLMTIVIASVGIGLFFWPLIVLNVALRDSFFVRPDRIIYCIIRTIGPYLICCAFVYASYFVWYLYGAMMASKVENSAAIQAMMILVNLCTRIFAMRVIGMFYRHYEDRLDW